MSFSISAFIQSEWKPLGLADFGDFADRISECNVGDDAFGGFGEWFFVPDEPLPTGDRVIYCGSWGNDHSPGASMYTHAEVFNGSDPDELAEFTIRVQEWESKPEFLEGEFVEPD